jgi:hypothetical protein
VAYLGRAQVEKEPLTVLKTFSCFLDFIFDFKFCVEVAKRYHCACQKGNPLENISRGYPISLATAPEGSQYPLAHDQRVSATL